MQAALPPLFLCPCAQARAECPLRGGWESGVGHTVEKKAGPSRFSPFQSAKNSEPPKTNSEPPSFFSEPRKKFSEPPKIFFVRPRISRMGSVCFSVGLGRYALA